VKYVLCQNNDSKSKYFKGIRCYEEVLIDDRSQNGLCWKCTAMMVPIEEKKSNEGYPRGWKFMSEFVDKDGNVYHKGELQEELFGTLPPTEIKKSEKKIVRKKKNTLDDKVVKEYTNRILTKKKLKNKRSK
jgi:hypothetical protein